MIADFFRYALIGSASAHFIFFGLFSLSSGPRLLKNESQVNFWGQLLSRRQIQSTVSAASRGLAIAGFNNTSSVLINAVPEENIFFLHQPVSAKPPAGSLLNFLSKEASGIKSGDADFKPVIDKGKEIIFYPSLPSSFELYFRDRQVAHVELLFNIEKNSSSYQIMLRRKISSGNLEADLLTSRYIKRYLYTQSNLAWAEGWRTVKIDLSPKK